VYAPTSRRGADRWGTGRRTTSSGRSCRGRTCTANHQRTGSGGALAPIIHRRARSLIASGRGTQGSLRRGSGRVRRTGAGIAPKRHEAPSPTVRARRSAASEVRRQARSPLTHALRAATRSRRGALRPVAVGPLVQLALEREEAGRVSHARRPLEASLSAADGLESIRSAL
jgi:hypothetical protein